MRASRRKLELNRNTAGARASYLRVAEMVAAATGIPFRDIIERQRPGRPCRRRGNPKSFARLVAIYLTVTGCNVRQGALARAIGRPRIRVLQACREIENARDNQQVDALLERMEAML